MVFALAVQESMQQRHRDKVNGHFIAQKGKWKESTQAGRRKERCSSGKGSPQAGSHQPRWLVETAPAQVGLRDLLLEGSAIIIFTLVVVLIIFCYRLLPPSELSLETKSN